MQNPRKLPSASLSTRALRTVLLPLLLTCTLWLLRSNNVSFVSMACSLLLAFFPLLAYFQWREHRDASAIPLFAVVSAMVWVAFALPLTWGRESIMSSVGPRY